VDNLADTLGAKMRKILGKQLALGAHPAAGTQSAVQLSRTKRRPGMANTGCATVAIKADEGWQHTRSKRGERTALATQPKKTAANSRLFFCCLT
jgi:hypothetical protein